MEASEKKLFSKLAAASQAYRQTIIQIILFIAFLIVLGLIIGWPLAIVVTICLLIHESGHLWAMKRCGLELKGLYFIPGLGAAAVPKGDFSSRADECFIAIMGPVWGALAGLLAVGLYGLTQWEYYRTAIWACAFINLFNLLPISPLDGGRVIKNALYGLSPTASVVVGWLIYFGGVLVMFNYSFALAIFIGLFGSVDLRLHGLKVRQERDWRRIKRAAAEASPRLQELLWAAEVIADEANRSDEEVFRAVELVDGVTDHDRQEIDTLGLLRQRYLNISRLEWDFVTSADYFVGPIELYLYLTKNSPDRSIGRWRSLFYIASYVVLAGLLLLLGLSIL